MDPIYLENLAYFDCPQVRAAYERLFALALALHLEITFDANGANHTMKLHATIAGKKRYAMSADRAQRHFTFYIRSWATRAWPDLIAASVRIGGRHIGEQVQFRVETPADIERIWALVAPKFRQNA